MKLKEVQDSFFEFEDKKIILIQRTQAFFLKHKFSPYIWLDPGCRLHVKIKHRRGTPYKEIDTNILNQMTELSQEWANCIDAEIIWTQNVEYWDETLIGNNKVICEREIIYKVGEKE